MSREMMLGRTGEDIALEMLENRGLTLIERNWRWHHKELDLIMEGSGTVHFIEVKTLRVPTDRNPWEAVTPEKQKNLAVAAEHYIYEHRIVKEAQFDIVSILYDESGGTSVEYIEKAFFPIF